MIQTHKCIFIFILNIIIQNFMCHGNIGDLPKTLHYPVQTVDSTVNIINILWYFGVAENVMWKSE